MIRINTTAIVGEEGNELEVEGQGVEAAIDAHEPAQTEAEQPAEFPTTLIRLPVTPAEQPDSDASTTIAAIYVRPYLELDSNGPLLYEAIGILNGEEVYNEANIPSRKQAVIEAARAIAADAAEGEFRDDRIASKVILDFAVNVDGLAEDDEIPSSEVSVWPVGGVAVDSGGDTEDAVPPEGPADACGEVGESAGEVADEQEEEEADAEQQADEPNPAADATALAHFNAQLTAAKDELAEAAIESSHAEAAAKAAKTRLKEAITAIERIAVRGPQRMPLFDGKEGGGDGDEDHGDSESKEHSHSPASTSSEASEFDTDADTTVATADPNAWRFRSIDELGLPPKLAEKLADNGITTIGALEDQRAAFKGLRAIKGIGEQKADAIEAAVLGWLDRNRDVGMVGGKQ